MKHLEEGPQKANTRPLGRHLPAGAGASGGSVEGSQRPEAATAWGQGQRKCQEEWQATEIQPLLCPAASRSPSHAPERQYLTRNQPAKRHKLQRTCGIAGQSAQGLWSWEDRLVTGPRCFRTGCESLLQHVMTLRGRDSGKLPFPWWLTIHLVSRCASDRTLKTSGSSRV